MGALHKGHLSLVEKSLQQCDFTIVSIYLNPTQFAPDEDLASYPNSLEKDLQHLSELSIDAVFLPSDSEMYPEGFSTFVNETFLSGPLEGQSRPLFFKGITTIVAKLFNIVQPSFAFFGEKDAQQLHIIQKIVKDLYFPLEIIPCPTIRGDNGLALSSRNEYLSKENLETAANINKSLLAAKNMLLAGERIADTIRNCLGELLNERGLLVDYVSVADHKTLREISGEFNDTVLVSVAVYLGDTRLIDNFTYSPSSSK